MCTVTYIPTKQGCFITSNRDEDKLRGASTLPPQWYHHINEQHISTSIMYPKDSQKGGTWIAVKKNGDVIVLLNGALKKHTRKQAYTKSRGLIVIDILHSQDMVVALQQIYLDGVEPFTCIVYTGSKLYEMRWDEKERTITQLNQTESYIWSSCTLYNETVQVQRKALFHNFVYTSTDIRTNAIIAFHKSVDYVNTMQACKRDFIENIATVSITHISINNINYEIVYHDLFLIPS
jgi:uncharacterized protein with NRDE domain